MITTVIIAALSGSLLTGGAMWWLDKRDARQDANTAEVLKAIGALETEFEQAQGKAVVNLTEPDLLQVPCSSEYIEKHGEMLCREMFCRMNRQGGGQNSGGGAGATAQDCSAISDASIAVLIAETCLPLWSEGAGSDQNSKYSRCIDLFDDKK